MSQGKTPNTGWGLNRLVQSVQNTVASTQAASRAAQEAKDIGKIWDAKTKTWVFYFLDQEATEQQQALQDLQTAYQTKYGKAPPNSMAAAGGASDEPSVKDRLYYDWLECRTDTTQGGIRKAYFKMAKQYHPDKKPEGLTPEEAQTKFHQINVAYQVLSNADKRKAYDKDGPAADTPDKEGNASDNPDPMVFFHVLFASDLVQQYVGELYVFTQANNVFSEATKAADKKEEDDDDDAEKGAEALAEEEEARMEFLNEQSKLQQKLRQAQCAQHLRTRVADFDADDVEAFCEKAAQEAQKIVQDASTPALGALYCQTLGRTWQMQAETYLGRYQQAGDWWTGPLARSQETATSVSTNLRLVGAGIQALAAGSRAMKQAQTYEQEKKLEQSSGEADQKMEQNSEAADEKTAGKNPGQSEALLMEALSESLPSFLKLAWTMNQRDIQQTLKGTCQKLLDDAAVPLPDRFTRARAIRLLGRTFLKVGETAVPNARQVLFRSSSEDIQAQLAVATMTTMAKAQGQEVTPADYAAMREQVQGMKAADEAEGDPETERL
jgi:curved DNA-binding protein CbpA